MAHQPEPALKRPLGVSVLALLLFLFSGISFLAALLPAPPDGEHISWPMYLLLGAYCLVVGWGIWGVQRWAYLTILLGCLVQIFFAFRTALILQRNALVPFLLAAVVIGYLLQPRIRSLFLHSR